MSHFEITGGKPLCGEVRVSGAKNAALPILAAAILASEPVRLENVPQLADVQTQLWLLGRLGVRSTFLDGALLLETCETDPVRAAPGLVRQMRAGFCVLGPLLARRGKAIVPLPGGCNIGHRPVDLHLKGLAALGADLRLDRGYVVATAPRLRGAAIHLSSSQGPTVTGTANIMSAAVLARGTTVVHGAALEPEIVDLGRFLAGLGAKIEGLGTPVLRIEGVEQLGGGAHRLIHDRIEAATLLLAAATAGGSITVHKAAPQHLAAILEKLDEAGASVEANAEDVSITVHGRLRAVNIVAEPYPGIPTDTQAQWTALAAVAQGVSRVEDRVFPSRFLHVAELNRLGANILCERATAHVTGVTRLRGARVTAHDLRASAALVAAGLAAKGRTVVDQIHHLDRGYQTLDKKLRRLGAQIHRIAAPAALLP